ncbi:hypothetical protein PLIP_a2524 [Pseudoalteromonas lipolytica LMEB 39]|nr:hypothetical protein [Pseudoalteromonas lipolytica LMEB 39]
MNTQLLFNIDMMEPNQSGKITYLNQFYHHHHHYHYLACSSTYLFFSFVYSITSVNEVLL